LSVIQTPAAPDSGTALPHASSADPLPVKSDLDRASTLYPNEAASDAAKAEAARAEAAANPPAQAPQPYQLQPLDGFEIDQGLAEEATPVLRELGLDDAGANRLMPLAAKVVTRAFERQLDDFTATKAEWAKQSKADPTIGQQNWPATERLISRALDAAGAGKGSLFRQLLDESGLGNHPAFIAGFRKIGERLGALPSKPKSRAEAWYPNMNKTG
jgi:hypothetical protein